MVPLIPRGVYYGSTSSVKPERSTFIKRDILHTLRSPCMTAAELAANCRHKETLQTAVWLGRDTTWGVNRIDVSVSILSPAKQFL